MAHDAVLEAIICGIGYEMTPSEEELNNRRRLQQQQQQVGKAHSTAPHHSFGNYWSSTKPTCDSLPFQDESHDDGAATGDRSLRDGTGERPGNNKLRRAFSLNSYRNPFRTKSSASSSATMSRVQREIVEVPAVPPPPSEGHDAKRNRLSWRKFLLKIAAQFGGSNLIVSHATL